MITLVEALNYRCLRYVQQPLQPFHVLVGPNASGKSTFLDVISFLGDIVLQGLEYAVDTRSDAQDLRELLFRGKEGPIELAVEAKIPELFRLRTSRPDLNTVRYQVAIGFDIDGYAPEFKAETLMLKKESEIVSMQRSLFPQTIEKPNSILVRRRSKDIKIVLNKVQNGNDNFYSEVYHRSGRGWGPSFKLGPSKSGLGNLPADEESFPVASWFRLFLAGGVQKVMLDSMEIKRPSPPRLFQSFLSDGSNLPWVIARLHREDSEKYAAWIAHLRTALPDLVDIATIERPEDRHCYMVYEFKGGIKVPSWLVSDGTLRLTALTLPAYLTGYDQIYLIEEPENGIHPKAVATMFESLSSVYDGQVLLATHSPIVLNIADRNAVLCFAKDDEGATDVVLGSEHPALQHWQGQADLGTLLASGVLG